MSNICSILHLVKESPFYIDNPKDYKGKWKSTFKVERPLHIELGCGKGQFIFKMNFSIFF